MSPMALPRAVDFDNFRDERARGEAYVDEGGECVEFDLSGLEECNSLAIALLMAWFRYAHARGKSVVYAGAPTGLQDILEVSGLHGVLPLRQV